MLNLDTTTLMHLSTNLLILCTCLSYGEVLFSDQKAIQVSLGRCVWEGWLAPGQWGVVYMLLYSPTGASVARAGISVCQYKLL